MPAIAAAVIGAGGAIGGGLLANRQPASVKNALNAESALTNFGLTTGGGAINEALSYFSPLVSGDRTALTAAEGPNISGLAQEYAKARQTLSQFGQRGGGTASTMAQQPFNLADQITQLIQGARSSAATNVANIGGKALGEAGPAAATSIEAGLKEQEMTGRTMADLGSALGKIVGLTMTKGPTANLPSDNPLITAMMNLFGGSGNPAASLNEGPMG